MLLLLVIASECQVFSYIIFLKKSFNKTNTVLCRSVNILPGRLWALSAQS